MKCGDKDLPQNFTCNSNEVISGSVTLCGHPQPTLSWMVGDQLFNGSIVKTNAGKHQYTYSFNKEIDSGICGKTFFHQGTGFGHNMVTGSSLILMKNCEFCLSFYWVYSLFKNVECYPKRFIIVLLFLRFRSNRFILLHY